jgi:hypothetical protein
VHAQAEDADDDDGHTGGEDEQRVHGDGLGGETESLGKGDLGWKGKAGVVAR